MELKLYPPYVESTIPAQVGGRALEVPFRLNRAVGINQVVRICARIKTVSTNMWLGNVETTEFVKEAGGDYYTAYFRDLSEVPLSVGQYYKIQLAFIGANNSLGYYSTVGVFKCTAEPSLYIEGLNENNISNLYTYIGVYGQDGDGQDPTEKIYTYRFDLLKGSTIVASSGEQLHDSTQDESSYKSRDTWVLSQQLEEGLIYQIKYSVTTINGLKAECQYNITNCEFSYADDQVLEQYLKLENNFENGFIKLYFDDAGRRLKSAGGGFVISRASSEDHFDTWYDVMKFTLTGSSTSLPTELFKDFSVKQGVTYKYALQRYNDHGFYTSRLYFTSALTGEKEILADFEDMFLYDGTRQLKVRFNPKVSSFKATVLESKLDTIGGKYPFIFRNGNVKYKEFAISGLISYLADEEEFFMSDAELGFNAKHEHRHETAHKTDLDIRARSAHVDTMNMAAERTFKLEVLEWLTNGKPKLFRSPSEGNYIVRLLNVSMSPNDTLARMVHTFNSTAYEIAECNFENLTKYGLIEDHSINNEVLVFESIDIGSNRAGSFVTYGLNYIAGHSGKVYFAEISEATPGAIFTLKFLNNRGDVTVSIPHSGHYTVNIYDDPLVEISLKSLADPNAAVRGRIDIGYYDTAGVGDFGDVRKIAISDDSYSQYGRCDNPNNMSVNKYYSINNDTIDALSDLKFKPGYFYYLKAETRYSQNPLFYSNGTYYTDLSLDPSTEVKSDTLDFRQIYVVRDAATSNIRGYMDGATREIYEYPDYSISIQVSANDKKETIQLGSYDKAGLYILPALSEIKSLSIGSGVWIECIFQNKEYIYCLEEDKPEIKLARAAWVESGYDRSSTAYATLLEKIRVALLNS